MKRLVLFILASVLTEQTWAQRFQCGDLLYNFTSDTTVEVTYQYSNAQNYAGITTISIPDTIIDNGVKYAVTSIGESAFADCGNLISMTIPNTIMNIRASAFARCVSLVAIEIPNSVTEIGGWAFSNCRGLTSVNIGTVSSIGSNAFYGCNNIKTLTVNTNAIGTHFQSKASIETLIIGDSVTKIIDYAFSRCGGLTAVTLPNSIKEIGVHAFYGCDNIDYTIFDNAFYIGNNENPYLMLCSAKNNKIVSCHINEQCCLIYNDAFKDCVNMTEIEIPSSVIFVGSSAFENCRGLTKAIFSSIDNLCNINFKLGANPVSYAHHLFIGDMEIKELVIPETVKNIGDYTFNGCEYLSSVTIPNSVKTIGSSAFGGCNGLSSVIIGDSVKNIDYYAFSACTSLTSIIIGHSVESIGGSAFEGCSNLNSVMVPNSVKKIGTNAFKDCNSLQKVDFSDIESLCSINFENNFANPLCNARQLYINGKPIINLVIPESVSTIGKYAFYNCLNISSLVISDSVKSIGSESFNGCRGLTSVIIPNSVTQIGSKAFYGCENLKSLSYNTNALGAHFNNLSALESIFIGDSIRSISGSEFNGCDNLVNVICMAIVPPTLNGDPYTYADIIRVPASSVDAYKTAPIWKRKEILPLEYYTVLVSQSDTTRGTIIGNGTYAAKQAITIYAESANNYHFVNWSDGNTDNPRTIILNTNVNLSAIFEGKECTIYIGTENGGTYTCHYGDTLAFNASAQPGYHFVMWTDGVTDNPRTIVITGDSIFNAEFVLNTYTITATAENGTVRGTASYNHGENVTLTAIPNDGYHFVKWSDNIMVNPRSFTAEEDLSISAIIETHIAVVDVAVAATATTNGLTEGSHCSVCGAILVAQEVVPALGEQCGNESQGNENQGGGSENQSGNEQGGGNENQGGNNTNPATAVSEAAASAVNIYAIGNTIVVENATEEIRVYSVMGGLVATSNDVNAKMGISGSGVYIVKVGGVVKRVVVN